MSDAEQESGGECNQDLARIQKACDSLGEHFDSVQIFATRHEVTQGGTIRVSIGLGNWFARYGQIREWLIVEEETTRQRLARRDG